MHLCIIRVMSDKVDQNELVQIRAAVKTLGLRQVDIAASTGLSQSQVSRILRGQSIKRTANAEAVCVYVRSKLNPVSTSDVQACTPLLIALAKVWNGTTQHAQALTAVIESLGALTPPAPSDRQIPQR